MPRVCSPVYRLIESSLDGVLCVDEAAALNPRKSNEGRAVFEQLLAAAEKHRERLTIVFCGYKVCCTVSSMQHLVVQSISPGPCPCQPIHCPPLPTLATYPPPPHPLLPSLAG